jgi:hypothetical protein
MVKFIETGRISPTGFSEAFKSIYRTVHETVSQASASKDMDDHDDN